MDGGTGRLIAAALRAGLIKLDAGHLETLGELLNAEAAALAGGNGGEMQAYQESADINAKINSVVDYILLSRQVYPVAAQVVFAGDILFDRLSNNVPATVRLLRELHRKGAIFVAGNHDDLETKQRIKRIQRGYYAYGKISDAEALEARRLYFVNAWFDSFNTVFYSHHGVMRDKDSPAVLNTGFGKIADFDNKDITEIVATMNKYDFCNGTDFRPKDVEMEQLGLYYRTADGKRKPVTIVHGHSDSFDVRSQRVININARGKRVVPGRDPAAVGQQQVYYAAVAIKLEP